MTPYAATLDTIRAAHERIAPHIHRTPVLHSTALDALAGFELFFKCENLQRVGAFKIRGATNAILQLDEKIAQAGVVTHSSGNHAQAVALAARDRGIPAHVVMPTNAPRAKREATAGYGARIHPCEPTYEARMATCLDVARQTGATIIPPFDHAHIIAGQGTVALECVDQVDGLDAIVAPIGGGGLISGIALAARELPGSIRVIGGEPSGADDAARSKASGELVGMPKPRTIADGLRTGLGELTWPVVRDLVDSIVTVTDEDILNAMQLVWTRLNIVVEPSAATPFAAVLSPAFTRAVASQGVRRMAVVLTGGNLDLDVRDLVPAV